MHFEGVAMSKEEWRPIIGSHYLVSDLGRVLSRDRGEILKGAINKDGYVQFCMRFGGGVKNKLGHRLVLEAFVSQSDLVVDHINGNKTDNRLINLRYLTTWENTVAHFEKQKHYSSRYVGVSYIKRLDKWASYVTVNKKRIHLGVFCDEADAKNKRESFLNTNKETNNV